MARVYQMMGTRADQIMRNAIAGAQVAITAAGAADISNAFGGFNTTTVAGSVADVTWRATNSAVSPVVVGVGLVAAVSDVAAETDAAACVVAAIASNSCEIGKINGAGALGAGTVQVMVFGQHRNDFQTT